MKLTIRTNHVARGLIYGYELTPTERAEFDYIAPEELDTHEFFRFKGQVYDPSEFMRVEPQTMRAEGEDSPLSNWDGYQSDSYFSGVVIKYTDDFESVIVGQYFC